MLESIKFVFSPENLNFLLQGLWLTVKLSIVAVFLAVVLGTLLAIMRNYGPRLIRYVASAYIEIFRNTPLLLWMMLCGFIIKMGNMTQRGGFALFLYTSAVIAEIIRGGLNSIPKGQFETASSQGFNFFQTLRYIILPQTFKKVVPSLLSQIITTIKDTSLLTGLAVMEFTQSARVLMGRFSNALEIFIMYGFLALTYFAINFFISCIVRFWHKKNMLQV